ncbi:ornithine cyclodeaminase [Brenneria sp. g21c3]|uniref:ornithine cyclodeaminase n=1 Tax=Brenneria sp. g21c3 TaxID=3093893 RepID=UPI002EB2E4AE|nr:ornithine cyclodeaminase [Brenneria sp. g21c3]
MSPALRYLDRQAVVRLGGADPRQAYDDVVEVVKLMRRGETQMTPESHVDLATPRGKAYALPAGVGGRFNAAGVKWTVHRPQRTDALPQAMATTLINRLSDGMPLGIVESATLTAARTAAVSAVALRHAAPRAIRRVLLLGAGVQAQAHIEMLRALFPTLEKLVWWNRTPETPQRLFSSLPALPWPVEFPDTLSQALQTDYDALLACTSAAAPILGPDALRQGGIVLQIGYHEMQFSGIRQAGKVVVDLWGEFCRTSAKSLFQMYRAGEFEPRRVAADLGQLLIDGWRSEADDSVYFSSFGLNVFDIALAARVLQEAERRADGALLPLLQRNTDVD